MYVCLSLSVCLCLSVFSVYLCLSLHLFAHLYLCLSVCLFVCMSICSFADLSVVGPGGIYKPISLPDELRGRADHDNETEGGDDPRPSGEDSNQFIQRILQKSKHRRHYEEFEMTLTTTMTKNMAIIK